MRDNSKLVKLSISHFRFAISGEHYYGRLKPHGDIPSSDLSRLMTREEAKYLGQKDGWDYLEEMDEGHPVMTPRFDTPEQVLEHAQKVFPELFEPDMILYVNYEKKNHREDYWEYPRLYLAGPDDILKELQSAEGDMTEARLYTG